MSIITGIGKSVRSHLAGEWMGSGADQSELQVDVIKALSPAEETGKTRSRRAAGLNKQSAPHTEEDAVCAGKGSHSLVTGSQKKESKQGIVMHLLRRQDGATIDELMEATTWQAHSVRGFLSGTVRKKLALNLISDLVGNGVRRYRVEAGGNVNALAQADRSPPSGPSSERVMSDGAASDQAV